MGAQTTLTDLTVRYIEETIKSHVCEWECKSAQSDCLSDELTYKTMARAAHLLLHAVQLAEIEALVHHANGRPLLAAKVKEVQLPKVPQRVYAKSAVDIEAQAVETT